MLEHFDLALVGFDAIVVRYKSYSRTVGARCKLGVLQVLINFAVNGILDHSFETRLGLVCDGN